MPIIGTCSGLIDILEYKVRGGGERVRGRKRGERGRRIEREKGDEKEKKG